MYRAGLAEGVHQGNRNISNTDDSGDFKTRSELKKDRMLSKEVSKRASILKFMNRQKTDEQMIVQDSTAIGLNNQEQRKKKNEEFPSLKHQKPLNILKQENNNQSLKFQKEQQSTNNNDMATYEAENAALIPPKSLEDNLVAGLLAVEQGDDSTTSKKNESKTQLRRLLSLNQDVVILKKSVVYLYNDQIRVCAKRSLFLFTGHNPIRKFIARLISWKYFDYLMLLVILANSLALALIDYSDRDGTSEYNKKLDQAGSIFTYIFTIEAVLEIIVKGFIFHRGAYLRNGWGVLDFIVVVSGLIEQFTVGTLQLKSLRVLRALRPLRSITSIPSLRKLVSALIQSLPDFVNVGMFLVYILILFAILGTHLYNGVFNNACRFNSHPETSTSWAIDDQYERVCSKSGTGTFKCPADQYCGNPADFDLTPESDKVILKSYMYYGIHNFDNLAQSLLVVFQIVTAESWSTYMYNLMDVDVPLIAGLYTIILVMFGSFFLMNLILAVIIQAFINITKKELDEQVQKLTIEEEDGPIHLGILQEDIKRLKSQEADTVPIAPSNNKIAPEVVPMKANSNVLKIQRLTSSIMEGTIVPLPDQEGFIMPNNIEGPSNEAAMKAAKLMGIGLSRAKSENTPKNIKEELGFLKNRITQKKVLGAWVMKESPSSVTEETKSSLRSAGGLPQIDVVDIDQEKQNEGEKQPSSLAQRIGLLAANKSAAEKHNLLEDKRDKTEGAGETASNLKQFLVNKLEEDKSGKVEFYKLLQNARQNYDEARLEIQNQSTIRSLTAMKAMIHVMRQDHVIYRNSKRLRLETRAESNRFYGFGFKLIKSRLFTWSISIAIICNMIILALDKYPDDQSLSAFIDNFNIVFSFFFMFETIVKILGLGFKGYFSDNYNAFDSIIVLASIIDLFVSNLLQVKTRGVITTFRGFRLMRVFKMAKSWKRLDILLKTIKRTLQDVSTFSILLFLFMYTFALLGMELFAHRVKFAEDETLDLINGHSPPSNYDSLLNAFTTVFVVMTADGWSGIYFDHYRALQNMSATLYFILLVIIGQRVLLNLFLAILLQNFDEDALGEQVQRIENGEPQQSQQDNDDDDEDNDVSKDSKKLEPEVTVVAGQIKSVFGSMLVYFKNKITENSKATAKIQAIEDNQTEQKTDGNRAESPDQLNNDQSDKKLTQVAKAKSSYFQLNSESTIEGRALCMFGPQNYLRLQIFELVNSKKFDFFIVLVILLSSIQLAMDSPRQNPHGETAKILYILDAFTTVVFFIEAILKAIAYGFLFNGKPSYLRNPWSLMDFSIIVLSILSLTPLSDQLRIFKMFRILRVLRLISKNESLKVGVKALFFAMPNIISITIIMLLFFLIFGIFTVSFFKGKLFSCKNEHINFPVLDNKGLSDLIKFDDTFINMRFLQESDPPIIDEFIDVPVDPQIVSYYQQSLSDEKQIKSKWDCLSNGGDWYNRPQTFDNLYKAIGTLFIMATAASWAEIMYLCASTTEIDYVQIEMNNAFWIFYFIFFIVLASFFLMNLFVGVVISTFNSEQDKISGNDLLTEKQREWIDTRLIVLRSNPLPKITAPESKFRQFFFKIQQNSKYEIFILICIILNTAVLALKWYRQPDWIDSLTDQINLVFTAIFAAEAIIKILALGFTQYFRDGWSTFDFVVILISILSILLSLTSAIPIKGAVTIIRAVRILRVIRLIKRARSLNLIFTTFIVTLPPLVNIGGLLFLLLYLYSILGMQLFGQVMRNDMFTDNLNFETFTNSFCALCAVATGDAWSEIMTSALKQRNLRFQCASQVSYEDYIGNGRQMQGCGAGFEGILFFFSFYLLVNLIFLNLFIAIILQGFSDTQLKDQRLFNQDMYNKFRQVWSDFDPLATSFIPIPSLRDLLLELGQPLGFSHKVKSDKSLQDKFMGQLQLPTYNKVSDYQFMDVLDSLSLRSMVLDHMRKYSKHQKGGQNASGTDKVTRMRNEEQEEKLNQIQLSSDDEDADQENQDQQLASDEHETDVKKKIQLDINKLIYKKEPQDISAYKAVEDQELKQTQANKSRAAQRDTEFTSEHQTAAGIVIKQWRYYLYMKRDMHLRETIDPRPYAREGEDYPEELFDEYKTAAHLQRIDEEDDEVCQEITARDNKEMNQYLKFYPLACEQLEESIDTIEQQDDKPFPSLKMAHKSRDNNKNLTPTISDIGYENQTSAFGQQQQYLNTQTPEDQTIIYEESKQKKKIVNQWMQKKHQRQLKKRNLKSIVMMDSGNFDENHEIPDLFPYGNNNLEEETKIEQQNEDDFSIQIKLSNANQNRDFVRYVRIEQAKQENGQNTIISVHQQAYPKRESNGGFPTS